MIENRTAVTLTIVAFMLGVLIGARLLGPATCGTYREAHERGTACVVETPDQPAHIEYQPEER